MSFLVEYCNMYKLRSWILQVFVNELLLLGIIYHVFKKWPTYMMVLPLCFACLDNFKSRTVFWSTRTWYLIPSSHLDLKWYLQCITSSLSVAAPGLGIWGGIWGATCILGGQDRISRNLPSPSLPKFLTPWIFFHTFFPKFFPGHF